jgi:O-methyltransferase domain
MFKQTRAETVAGNVCMKLRSPCHLEKFERLSFIFFESWPCDAYAIVAKSVIHDCNDRRGVRILRNYHRVPPPRARQMVIDRIVPEQPSVDYLPAVSIDLNMLCGLGGYEG